jgi:spore coat polysaccharide biosynthesis protein SpsF (cytidylyltransferase family)
MLGASVLMRITADCPLIDPNVIDQVAEIYQQARGADYVFVQGYPVGLGSAELVTLSALERSLAETSPGQTYYREHVITYLLDHPEKFHLHIEDAPPSSRRPNIHLAVDEREDLEIVRRICEYFAPRIDFQTYEVLTFLEENPNLASSSMRRQQRP